MWMCCVVCFWCDHFCQKFFGNHSWRCLYFSGRGGSSGAKFRISLGLPVGAVINCADNTGNATCYRFTSTVSSHWWEENDAHDLRVKIFSHDFSNEGRVGGTRTAWRASRVRLAVYFCIVVVHLKAVTSGFITLVRDISVFSCSEHVNRVVYSTSWVEVAVLEQENTKMCRTWDGKSGVLLDKSWESWGSAVLDFSKFRVL